MLRPLKKVRRLIIRRRKILFLLLFAIVLVSSILVAHQIAFGEISTTLSTTLPDLSVGNRPSTGKVCPEVSAVHRRELFQLMDSTDRVLDKLRIVHFLCFKSLWGAIQESSPFPWDINGNFCALNTPGTIEYDEPTLLRAFRRLGLSLDYSSADAIYKITNASLPVASPNVFITLFEEDPRLGAGMYRRVGWKRRLLPPNCDAHSSLQCFPSTLVQNPLPKRTFGPLTLPTPRDNIDILKYHYPDMWYKPVESTC